MIHYISFKDNMQEGEILIKPIKYVSVQYKNNNTVYYELKSYEDKINIRTHDNAHNNANDIPIYHPILADDNVNIDLNI